MRNVALGGVLFSRPHSPTSMRLSFAAWDGGVESQQTDRGGQFTSGAPACLAEPCGVLLLMSGASRLPKSRGGELPLSFLLWRLGQPTPTNCNHSTPNTTTKHQTINFPPRAALFETACTDNPIHANIDIETRLQRGTDKKKKKPLGNGTCLRAAALPRCLLLAPCLVLLRATTYRPTDQPTDRPAAPNSILAPPRPLETNPPARSRPRSPTPLLCRQPTEHGSAGVDAPGVSSSGRVCRRRAVQPRSKVTQPEPEQAGRVTAPQGRCRSPHRGACIAAPGAASLEYSC